MTTPATAELTHPQTRTAFRNLKLLVGAYVAISVLTLAAIILLRDHPDMVTSAVWVRGTIVVASSLITYLLTVRAGQGNRGAYRRLRIISAALVVAIAVIIALPGTFPLWLKIEQGACGLILLGIVVIINGARLRSLLGPERG